MKLIDKIISREAKPIYVAEISCNHLGDLHKAKELIRLAKKAGADFIKIQAYEAPDLTLSSFKDDFIVKHGLWEGQSLWSLYEKTKTPYSWLPELFRYSREINIPIFSSVFSEHGLKELEKLKCPAYKIASLEFNYMELISKVAATGKPMLLSTGAAAPNEIDYIYEYLSKRAINFAFMHCVSMYPCTLYTSELNKISYLSYLSEVFGYSDHCKDSKSAEIAVALGARIIEKHIYSHEWEMPEDYEFSITPQVFKQYIRNCNKVFEATQENPRVYENSKNLKRSLYATWHIKKGEIFTKDNMRAIRPGYGLNALYYFDVLGKECQKDLSCGDKITLDCVKGETLNWKLPDE